MKDEKGFTLIELMIVVSIIGTLAAIAIPQFSAFRTRAYQCEGYALFESAKEKIIEFYEYTGFFPQGNAEAGLPAPDKIKGKYVESLKVSDGAVTVNFYQDFSGIEGKNEKVFIFQPAVLTDNPTGPVIWIKTYKDRDISIPAGFMILGQKGIDE